MDHFYKKKLIGKVDHLYPNLCAPNDGYNENNRWNGMTPEEVAKLVKEMDQYFYLLHWKPPDRPQ